MCVFARDRIFRLDWSHVCVTNYSTHCVALNGKNKNENVIASKLGIQHVHTYS